MFQTIAEKHSVRQTCQGVMIGEPLDLFFHFLPCRDVLDSQQNDLRLSNSPFNLPGIQKHDASADGGEIVNNLIVVKECLLGKDGFQQFPQLGDIPLLLIAQVVNKLAHGLLRLHLEDAIE